MASFLGRYLLRDSLYNSMTSCSSPCLGASVASAASHLLRRLPCHTAVKYHGHMPEADCPFVSRGGIKLQHALDQFNVDPTGFTCADLGCSTGGFTDCLLQAGAARVYSVDTGYGVLAWKLRQDDRVTVLERSNALHVEPPAEAAHNCDIVVIDLGWTKQQRAIPAALQWLTESDAARIITLIKPHYEVGLPGLSEDEALAVARQTCDAMPGMGVDVLDITRSPITGSKGGNIEYLAMLCRG